MDLRTCIVVFFSILYFTLLPTTIDALRRCVHCRSRGEQGSCKDPFTMNSTQIELERGVDMVPCVSGWCGKIIESQNLNNEYGTATQRLCFQRGPDDGEERCAYTTWNYRKVYMCLCLGDLCNGAINSLNTSYSLLVLILCLTVRWVL
ncbi:PREDICTED: uncharacterized protein LOC106787998 [Polistes canadensis]|uniref:uncharacterized protein LOC106787998 n=1 Tax=Polistes canadensis TaxID=91411 RepID=UPI000718D846|nr:PREDICTED: uncharacterized protein LOC106787998 [Polistes canadensis]XP_014606343.1 PREDICTED: uncharacterized protein LOC106787998 [Polistes canadensis]